MERLKTPCHPFFETFSNWEIERQEKIKSFKKVPEVKCREEKGIESEHWKER